MSGLRHVHDPARHLATGSAGRIFGDPYETPDGSTVITVAQPSRWRGTTVPVGVFVIKDGRSHWEPAVDATRIALMGETIGLAAAVIATLAVLRRPPWPDLSRKLPVEPGRRR